MKFLIYGKGYLGNHFYTYLQTQGEEVVWGEADIGNLDEVERDIEKNRPDTILNCAGKTGRPNVDWCEDHKEETLYANVTGPLILWEACFKHGVKLVHLGSGCIYDGYNDGKGFSEEDPANFHGSFYSKTKNWGEQMLKEFPVLQLRLRMPIDANAGPRNFISKIIKYEKVINIQNSMTVIEDLLPAGYELIKRGRTGIYNMTNPGTIDHVTILDMYKEIANPDFKYTVMSVEEMLEKYATAQRSNCMLNTQKLEGEGIHMRPIEMAIRECIEKGFKGE